LNLRSQRRIAAQVMKVGINRVWINPEHIEDVEVAITREEIRKLVHEGVIRPASKAGISRVRARILNKKKKEGLRSGPGTKSGARHAKISKKQAWMSKIRVQRRTLKEWKANHLFTEGAYRKLYMMAGSGAFGSIAEMERYSKTHGLRKR
jgi:large subunit ribosomal protein L19e